jgi:hypothetical protein
VGPAEDTRGAGVWSIGLVPVLVRTSLISKKDKFC